MSSENDDLFVQESVRATKDIFRNLPEVLEEVREYNVLLYASVVQLAKVESALLEVPFDHMLRVMLYPAVIMIRLEKLGLRGKFPQPSVN